MVTRIVIKGHENVYITKSTEKVIKLLQAFWEEGPMGKNKMYIDCVETTSEEFVNLDIMPLSLINHQLTETAGEDGVSVPMRTSELFSFLEEEDSEGDIENFLGESDSDENLEHSIEKYVKEKQEQIGDENGESENKESNEEGVAELHRSVRSEGTDESKNSQTDEKS